MEPLVLKADGETEPFNPQKLIESLERSGASKSTAEVIRKEVEKELYNGITTSEIYRHAFAHLRQHKRTAAARYSLKRAILDFGPSGFPFESYLAEIFRAQGYAVRVDQIVHGGCVEHEVDVVAQKNKDTLYVEAKFHNAAGFKTDLKTALYVKARMDDLRAVSDTPQHIIGMLATNTKFTEVAVQYATCAGVELLGWEYPHKGNLHDMVDATGLYPITALTSLNRFEKDELLQDRIVLCNEIQKQEDAFNRIGIKGKRMQTIVEEAAGLCVPGTGI